MSYYAVLDIKKIKGFGGFSSQEAHNNRDYPMNHVDENLSYLNKEIVSTGGISYKKRFDEIITNQSVAYKNDIKIRKGAVLAFNIVTAFTPGAEKALNIDIDKWCEKNKEWMEQTFGKDNIINMSLHMDEVDNTADGRRGVHLHTLVVPIDDRGHLCAKSFTGKRVDMKNLQTSYGKAMEEFGLERGENNSKLKHTERKRWYHAVSKICNSKAPRKEENESMESYYERLDNAFQEIGLQASKIADKANKAIAMSQTRQAQIFGEYAYAVNLQHILEEEYGGDMFKVNNRLKNYQILEKAVPRKNLATVIDKLQEKYPPENSLSFYRRGKKKKHKKWESLPDETTNVAASSSSAPIYFPIDDDEEELKNQNIEIGNTNENLEELEKTDGSVLSNAFGETLED